MLLLEMTARFVDAVVDVTVVMVAMVAMVKLERKERREIPVCQDQKVHQETQETVEQSTRAGGGPLAPVSREQSWSTVEELEGAGTITKEGLPTISACQLTQTTLTIHLEYKDIHMYMELSIK